MSYISHIITGTGRCGTTFLAHVFHNAGVSMGNISAEQISAKNNPIGGGMELREFARLNTKMMTEIHVDTLHDIAERYRVDMEQQWPQYIKDPRYLLTWPVWEHARIRPLHVFLCIRNPNDIDLSIQKTTNWNIQDEDLLYRKCYSCINYLIENDIPYTYVHYPRIAHDRAYAERILGAYITHPWEIVQKTWNADLQHFKEQQ